MNSNNLRTVKDILQILEATNSVGWAQTYVGKNYTKQNLIDDLRQLDQYQQLPGGWIEWPGGQEAPVVHGTLVDVKYLNGSVAYGCRAGYDGEGAVVWDRVNDDLDIVAYRVIEYE